MTAPHPLAYLDHWLRARFAHARRAGRALRRLPGPPGPKLQRLRQWLDRRRHRVTAGEITAWFAADDAEQRQALARAEERYRTGECPFTGIDRTVAPGGAA